MPDFSHLDDPADWFVARQFDDEWTNILFVGRVIANKKIEDRDPLLPRVPHDVQPAQPAAHRRRVQPVRALFRGADAPGRRAAAVARALRRVTCRTRSSIAYYEVADLFLCASEHEGFCVPLVEAFYKQVPVLAYAATAVPATMDGAGVLFDDKDPAHVAALMDAILSDADLQDAIVDGQLAAVERLQAKDFDGTLLGFVDRILASPRRGAPRVAFDFWHQFDAAEAARGDPADTGRRPTRRCPEEPA